MIGRLQVSRDAMSRELDGEVLVLDLRSSVYFGMTGTAARIWQLAETGATRDAMVDTLAEEYGGPRDIVAADVDRFLSELLERGLLDSTGP
jgi:hypothetical protein